MPSYRELGGVEPPPGAAIQSRPHHDGSRAFQAGWPHAAPCGHLLRQVRAEGPAAQGVSHLRLREPRVHLTHTPMSVGVAGALLCCTPFVAPSPADPRPGTRWRGGCVALPQRRGPVLLSPALPSLAALAVRVTLARPLAWFVDWLHWHCTSHRLLTAACAQNPQDPHVPPKSKFHQTVLYGADGMRFLVLSVFFEQGEPVPEPEPEPDPTVAN